MDASLDELVESNLLDQPFTDIMSEHMKRKASAESDLLQALVGTMAKMDNDLKQEKKERMRLENEIKTRNETDDEQLKALTKTVDTLLFNLQGFESASIARDDDTELERANQAKRRSLDKKKKLRELKEKEDARLEAESIKRRALETESNSSENEPAVITAMPIPTTDDIVLDDSEDQEELEKSKAAFAKAKAMADELDRAQDAKRKEKEREMASMDKDAEAAKRWYAASIIQTAFRHYNHMKIWKSATDFGRQRVKDGNAISSRISKLEKMVIDLNAYRQRQEEELIEAQRLAEQMKRDGKFGTPELQQVIERIENALSGKVEKEQVKDIATSIEMSLVQVEEVRTEQADIREEMKKANEVAQSEGMVEVQKQVNETKQELSKALASLEDYSRQATSANQNNLEKLRETLETLQSEHAALGAALGVATKKDPKAVSSDDVAAAMESLENKMEALKIAKLGDEELALKMQPLIDQLGTVKGSLTTLQSANKKVKESTIINQQKLAGEAQKRAELEKSLAKVREMAKDAAAIGGGGGGGGGHGSSHTDQEREQQHGMLMEDIQSRLHVASESANLEAQKNNDLLKNLDGRLRSQAGQVGTTLERLQKEVGEKVSEQDMRDLQERLKNEIEPTLETVNGMNTKMTLLTTKNDVQKMIAVLRKKQEELSAIGVKCLVCSQNVPGGMASPSSYRHKQFPGPGLRQQSLEELRNKTFDPRVGHKLSDLMTSPLRRASALRQMKKKWEKGFGGNVSGMHSGSGGGGGGGGASMPKDGYGPVGWTRIESNESYVDRRLGEFGANGRSSQVVPESSYDTNGRSHGKLKIKIQPRNTKGNIGVSFPPLDRGDDNDGGKKNQLEFGLSVKQRSHLLRV